ncbi:MAG: helix-turn-helix transcriptional regulator [Eubacteriales bacterium]|nr:helix-turn-helix transcriptional regulator [Eubacteriales bacterium]
MEDLKQIVSQNIARLRVYNKLTQLELGEKLNYSDKAISKWERGESIPDAYVLKQMSALFHVSVDYLLSDHASEKKLPLGLELHNRLTITKISFVGVWALAILVFVILLLCGQAQWLVFVFALPLSLVVLLVFNSLWGKRPRNFYIISALIWSVLATVYLSFLQYNWWILFLLGIPAEVILSLCFKIHRVKKP